MGRVLIGIDQARCVAIRSPRKIVVMTRRGNRSITDVEWGRISACMHTISSFLVNGWAVVGHNLEACCFGLSSEGVGHLVMDQIKISHLL